MKEVLPIANKLDPEQGEIPMSLRDKMGEMGYFGIRIPEEYGGLGLGAFEYVLVTEELARAWMSVASIIARGNGYSDRRSPTSSGRSICRKWRAANSSARRRSRNPMRARTSPSLLQGEPTDDAAYSAQWHEDLVHIRRWRRLYLRACADRADHGYQAPPSRHRQFLVEKPRGQFPRKTHRLADSQNRLLRLEDLGTALRWHRQPLQAAGAKGRRLPGDCLRTRNGAGAYRGPRNRPRARRPRGLDRSTRSVVCSSAIRSAISRRFASRSPRWRRRSRRLAN